MKKMTLVSAAVLAVTAPLALAPAASAAVVTVADGDDTTMAADIHRVRVAHNPRTVRVRITFDDVRRELEPGQGLSIFLDTDPKDSGPEFRLVAGLNQGTDYTFASVARWAGPGKEVRGCTYRMTINWKKDVVTFTAARKCLGKPDTVAAAVRAGEQATGGEPQVDWMTGVRKFSPAVAVG